MNKLFLFFFFISVSLFSQEMVVCDVISKQVIPFVTIQLIHQNKNIGGNYCDEKGLVKIESKTIFDKIIFSSIGYQSKSIEKTALLNDTVFLNPETIKLDEVLISKRNKNNYLTIGYSESKYEKKINLSGSKGMEMVVFIDNIGKTEVCIKSFLFHVNRRKKYTTALRIHLYEANLGNFEPGRELLEENVIRFLDRKSDGLVEINLEKYNLKLPLNGVFIGIEWLGLLDENTGAFVDGTDNHWTDSTIRINYNINRSITFWRNRLYKNTWQNTERFKKEFAHIKSNNYPNASFGLKVYNE